LVTSFTVLQAESSAQTDNPAIALTLISRFFMTILKLFSGNSIKQDYSQKRINLLKTSKIGFFAVNHSFSNCKNQMRSIY